MSQSNDHAMLVNRRAFLRNGSALVLATSGAQRLLANEVVPPAIKIGLVTDLHYADKPTKGTRYYRETRRKLLEAVEYFAQERPDFIVELGDLIDSVSSVEGDRAHLQQVSKWFDPAGCPRHYVLGNHCVEKLVKREFLDEVERDSSFYSFDVGHTHFVVLDACFREDGQPYGRENSHWTDANIPPEQLEWLQADLSAAPLNTVVFAHQRLDVAGKYTVKNAAAVRQILEKSGKVTAVFQGHYHKNAHQEIHGIHYCTLAAMIEGSGAKRNGYSNLQVYPDGSMKLTGFFEQASYQWPKKS